MREQLAGGARLATSMFYDAEYVRPRAHHSTGESYKAKLLAARQEASTGTYRHLIDRLSGTELGKTSRQVGATERCS